MGEEEKKKEDTQVETTPTKKEEEGEKKDDKPAAEDHKDEKKGADDKPHDQSPPPQEIVLKVYMHCEGCARKVRRGLQGFPGVEDVSTDCKSGKVVVKGEKADPLKVLGRLEKKTHRKVELLSPIPEPPPAQQEEKKTEPEQPAAANKQQEEQQVIIVVLKVYMHCEACAMEMKKRILKMKGVESVEPDPRGSQVTVKGVFEAEKLAEYILKRTGKHAAILKHEPDKKQEEQNKEEKKAEEAGGDNKDKKEGSGAGEEAGKAKEQEGGDGAKALAEAEDGETEEISKVVNYDQVMKRNEYYYHQNYNHLQRYNNALMEMHSYPPQIFSDENPNACCVM